MRWNADRATAAISSQSDTTLYTSSLKHAANKLGEDVFGKKIFPNYVDPRQYTGTLIHLRMLNSFFSMSIQRFEQLITFNVAGL